MSTKTASFISSQTWLTKRSAFVSYKLVTLFLAYSSKFSAQTAAAVGTKLGRTFLEAWYIPISTNSTLVETTFSIIFESAIDLLYEAADASAKSSIADRVKYLEFYAVQQTADMLTFGRAANEHFAREVFQPNADINAINHFYALENQPPLFMDDAPLPNTFAIVYGSQMFELYPWQGGSFYSPLFTLGGMLGALKKVINCDSEDNIYSNRLVLEFRNLLLDDTRFTQNPRDGIRALAANLKYQAAYLSTEPTIRRTEPERGPARTYEELMKDDNLPLKVLRTLLEIAAYLLRFWKTLIDIKLHSK
jgi:hypothetical protein